MGRRLEGFLYGAGVATAILSAPEAPLLAAFGAILVVFGVIEYVATPPRELVAAAEEDGDG